MVKPEDMRNASHRILAGWLLRCILAFVFFDIFTVCINGQAVQEPIKLASGIYPFELVKRVPVAYPAAARNAHVEGTVGLRAIIGRDGAVQHLDVVEGPGLLRDAAINAVKQWVYAPYVVDGQPRAVQTVIQVNFAFSGKSSEAPEDARLQDYPRVSMANNLLSAWDPSFTTKPHGKGLVSLDLLIGPNGNVQDVFPVHGSEELIAIAQSAVRQWKYTPRIFRGAAITVVSRVTFDFE